MKKHVIIYIYIFYVYTNRCLYANIDVRNIIDIHACLQYIHMYVCLSRVKS